MDAKLDILISTGALFVINEKITIGELVMFEMLISLFISPITDFLNLVPKYHSCSIAYNEICGLILEEIEDLNLDVRKMLPLNTVSFKNVFFSYYKSNKYTLNDLCFEVHNNQKVVLVGETGSGKTTIIKLLMRFYSVKQGEILIDGENIENINIAHLREKIGYVSQNNYLFNDTILNNIVLDKKIPIDEVRLLCSILGLDEFISRLPYGYNTKIKENGKMLSGGQRQKICIARALIKKPKLIIFDEATSNLDSLSENKILNYINSLSDTIVILITHRMNTIENSDVIIYLENGNIVATGSHNDLYKNDISYRKMWETQRDHII